MPKTQPCTNHLKSLTQVVRGHVNCVVCHLLSCKNCCDNNHVEVCSTILPLHRDHPPSHPSVPAQSAPVNIGNICACVPALVLSKANMRLAHPQISQQEEAEPNVTPRPPRHNNTHNWLHLYNFNHNLQKIDEVPKCTSQTIQLLKVKETRRQ